MRKKSVMCIALAASMMMGIVANAEEVMVSFEKQSMGLEGVKNARQLGGYAGADGKIIKDNLLLRTGKLSDATEEDLAKLAEEYQVKKVIDFRTTDEMESAPDPNVGGAENLWISILEETGSSENMAVTASYDSDPVQALVDYAKSGSARTMYTDIVTSEHAQEGYAQFFDELIAQEEGAVLWHCTGGKDRAGLASVLLLSALGADEETILADFELSNAVYQTNIEYMGQAAEEKGCTEEEVNAVKALAGVSVEYMKEALELIDSEYGSMHDYLNNQLDVSDEEIAVLQARYLE